MFPFIIKAEYWNDLNEPWTLDHIQVLLYAESHSDAISKFENLHYVDNIETIKAILAGDENTLFEVPGHIAKILAAGAGNYRDGLKQVKNGDKIAAKLQSDIEIIASREKCPEDIPFPQDPDGGTVYCPR